jgi:hypothetical protein
MGVTLDKSLVLGIRLAFGIGRGDVDFGLV